MSVPVADTVAHLRALARDDAARAAARLAELEAWLPKAEAILRGFGASRMLVFGSVATGETTPASDLDLAVEGLPSEAYFDALADLSRALPCDVDLVRLEEAPASLRDRVSAEGREL